MEHQRIPFRLKGLTIAVYAGHLARGNKYQSSFLVVVGMPAIYQVAAFYIFQENGIESEIHLRTLSRGCFRQVNHAHQWMSCFIVVINIIIINGIKPAHSFHNTSFTNSKLPPYSL